MASRWTPCFQYRSGIGRGDIMAAIPYVAYSLIVSMTNWGKFGVVRQAVLGKIICLIRANLRINGKYRESMWEMLFFGSL